MHKNRKNPLFIYVYISFFPQLTSGITSRRASPVRRFHRGWCGFATMLRKGNHAKAVGHNRGYGLAVSKQQHMGCRSDLPANTGKHKEARFCYPALSLEERGAHSAV
jgi:hypothetical protein